MRPVGFAEPICGHGSHQCGLAGALWDSLRLKYTNKIFYRRLKFLICLISSPDGLRWSSNGITTYLNLTSLSKYRSGMYVSPQRSIS